MAKLKMPRHELCRTINLSLAVERVEQSGLNRLLIGRKIVEPLRTLAWDMGRRHIEVASEMEPGFICSTQRPFVLMGSA